MIIGNKKAYIAPFCSKDQSLNMALPLSVWNKVADSSIETSLLWAENEPPSHVAAFAV